jgi:REP element-mobilizing transposase RayT
MKTYRDRRRKLKPYASYHVGCKINRDEIIFDKKISDLYLEIVKRCKKKYSFKIANFTVMGNHIHYLLTPGKKSPLPKIMQWINSVFAKAYNKLTGQSGHVWKERYFSRIIETVEQFLATFEYIVRNPIEANLVKNAKDFRPSGLYHYLHKKKTIITEDHIIHKLFEYCKDFHR